MHQDGGTGARRCACATQWGLVHEGLSWLHLSSQVFQQGQRSVEKNLSRLPAHPLVKAGTALELDQVVEALVQRSAENLQ